MSFNMFLLCTPVNQELEQNSPRDVKRSTGNIVDAILVTRYAAGGGGGAVRDSLGDFFVSYTKCLTTMLYT